MVAVVAVVVVAVVAAVPVSARPALDDPTIAPATTLSADGRTASDGVRTLAVSKALDLSPSGEVVSVSGGGYEVAKGVYVALCAVPLRNSVPTPCGGGVDTEGSAGASQWISSDLPSYGVGLAQPYGPGGTFTASFVAQPVLPGGIDCRVVRCAIVTRSDHTRTADRSQDIFVPVTFAATAPVEVPPPSPVAPGGDPGAGAATTAPHPPTLPPTTTTTVGPVPTTAAAPDGRSVSDGERTLRASEVEVVAGERVRVEGVGYRPDSGVIVALCSLADPTAPGPCAGGAVDASVWVSSTPPDYARDLAVPYGEGGTFSVELRLEPVIDTRTDCRVVPCALVTRPDDLAPDASQHLALPVRFVTGDEVAASSASDDAPDPGAPDRGDTGPVDAPSDTAASPSTLPLLVGGALVVGAAGALGLGLRPLLRSRRSAVPAP